MRKTLQRTDRLCSEAKAYLDLMAKEEEESHQHQISWAYLIQ